MRVTPQGGPEASALLASLNTPLHIVLLFAVKYKFMTLYLNTTINSSTLFGILHLIQHLLNL